MKKPENRPVCPYGTTYEEFLQERPGRKLRTPEAQRKNIDAMLDTLQIGGDFWTLEIVRRILQRLMVFDEAASILLCILSHLTGATEEKLKRVLYWASGIIFGFPKRKGGGKA